MVALHGGDGGPAFMPSWVCDKVSAVFAAQAALAALLERTRTGRGRLVDVPMLDAIAYFNFPDLMIERTVIDEENVAPVRLTVLRPVETRDGWMVVNLVRGRQITACLDALGLRDRQPDLVAISDPIDLSRALCDVVELGTRHLTTAEALDRLAAHDVPATAVLGADDHLRDPQVRHNSIYVARDDPRLGPVRQPHYPGRGLGVPAPAPPPAVDEGRLAVLDEDPVRRAR